MKAHNSFKKWLGAVLLCSVFTGLGGCSTGAGVDGAPSGRFDASNIPDAVPKVEPRSKYGNKSPYVVRGKRYYVLKDTKGYDKVGYASWYGTKFHGQRTSSREAYDMYSMTAASTVLPIPCYVRVTNLQNGRTTVVKVNDRGPFHSSRLIDLSYAAAQKLGYANKGTAKVRVTTIDVSAPSADTFLAQNTVDTALPSTVELPKSITSHPEKAVLPTQPLRLAQNSKDAASSLYLQVGAFRARSTAEDVSKQLTKLANNIPVAVKEGTSSGEPVYRVHIGPLQDADKSKMTQLLAKNGFNKPMVVIG